MSEINAIATNNYILHNIDAKKLYVQEPLFTANSGDAVYVGWRPDETVLFTQPRTSTTPVTAFTVTEKPSNFDRIRFNGYINGGRFSVEIPVDNTTDATMRFGGCSYSPDNYGSPLQLYGVSYSSNNGLNWTKVRETLRWFNQTTVTAVTGTTAAVNPIIYDIVGINRKENA
jgi:hypothetical protein